MTKDRLDEIQERLTPESIRQRGTAAVLDGATKDIHELIAYARELENVVMAVQRHSCAFATLDLGPAMVRLHAYMVSSGKSRG